MTSSYSLADFYLKGTCLGGVHVWKCFDSPSLMQVLVLILHTRFAFWCSALQNCVALHADSWTSWPGPQPGCTWRPTRPAICQMLASIMPNGTR